MSLTGWFTDYVYIPLGGSRKGIGRQIAATMTVFLFSGLIKCPVCGRNLGACHSTANYYRCVRHTHNDCSFDKWVSEKKVEQWLLENVEENFKVQVQVKPKDKKDDPKKYRDQLTRLNEMYLLGNISQAEYKSRSAEIQRKIAEISKNAPLKTQNFASNWKDLYAELDPKHRRAFWQNLVSEIAVSQQGQAVAVLY